MASISSMKRAAPVPPAEITRVSVAPSGMMSLTDGNRSEPSLNGDYSDAGNASMNGSRRSSRDETLTLNVVLPNNETCPFHVNKRMPLMDLLVHAASTYRFNPSEYAVYNPQAKFQSSFTPNTPVGELNTQVVQIVPKNSPLFSTLSKGPSKASSMRSNNREEPFEKTHRLQVNLPNRQKTVLRASPKQTLQDLLLEVCREKSLDAQLFTLRNPQNPNQPLDMYRQLAEERITEINLVPSFQETVAQKSQKFGTIGEINMEPPASPLYEKRRFGMDIFKLCRNKKRMDAGGESLSRSKEKNLSKSHNNLSTFSKPVLTTIVPVHDLPSKPSRKSKKPAPRPPDVSNGTNSNTLQINGHDEHHTTSYAVMEQQQQRTRHHSESSGYDESLVLSNSPERDGCSGDPAQGHQFGTPSPVLPSGEESNKVLPATSMPHVPISARSSTSTPDSGLKSASETVSKNPMAHSKKRAPAPPPPPVARELSLDEGLRTAMDELDRVIARDASAISMSNLSGRSATGSTSDANQLNRTSGETLGAVDNKISGNLKAFDESSVGDQTSASFTFEGSVAEQDFDEESSDGGSVDIHHYDAPYVSHPTTIESDVEVHNPPSSSSRSFDLSYRIHNDSVTVRRSVTLSSSSEDTMWMDTTIVNISEDSSRLPVSPLATEVTSAVRKSSVSSSEDIPEPLDDQKSRGVLEQQLSSQRESRSSIVVPPSEDLVHSGSSTPDSGIHSQRASLKKPSDTPAAAVAQVESQPTRPEIHDILHTNNPRGIQESTHPSPSPRPSKTASPSDYQEPSVTKPATSEVSSTSCSTAKSEMPSEARPAPAALKVVIPPQPKPSATLPSPSPSNSSLSSLRNAPTMPDSTPPPVTAKTLLFSSAPLARSPAHVSISSIKDQQPNRYREIVAHQQFFSRDVNMAPAPAPSRDELLKEIKVVQESVGLIQQQMKSMQLHSSSITPDDLAAISEQQQILQEHIQRQITLTQQLFELDERKMEFVQSTPSPTLPPKPVMTGPKVVVAPAAQRNSMASVVETKMAAVGVVPRKVPVVTKLNNTPRGEQKEQLPVAVNGFTGNESAKSAATTTYGAKPAVSLAEVVLETRPKGSYRNSWVAEATKRFNFNSSETDTAETGDQLSNDPVVTAAHNNVPAATSALTTTTNRINIGFGSHAADNEMDHKVISPTFSFGTRRAPTKVTQNPTWVPTVRTNSTVSTEVVSKIEQPVGLSMLSRNVSQNSSEKTSWKASTNASRDYELYAHVSRFPRDAGANFAPLKEKNTVEETVSDIVAVEDPVEAIVRSWKKGTPTPYHHVSVTGRATSNRSDENRVPFPPPPPPLVAAEAAVRSFSLPTRSTHAKAPAVNPDDRRIELLDEIKKFSVNSLRKVPSSNPKTYTPKFR